MKNPNEQHLILWSGLKAGNVDALGNLYDIFIDDLFKYGLQFCSDKSEVMDCIHDLFLNLFKYRKKLASTTQVKFYLLRSLKNQILNNRTKQESPFSPLTRDENCFSVRFCNSIEEKIICEEFKTEREHKLSNAMNTLSKNQKKVLFLRFTQDLSYEEIASIMNVSVQTSRTIIYRAIKVLRKNLIVLIISIYQFFY